MRIGKLVKQHIKQIFFHCDNVEHDEISSLLDPTFSNNIFGTNFPFCIELENIEQSQSIRYWTETYLVRGKRVRVTSQWYERSRQSFTKYLESKGIAPELDSPEYEGNEDQAIKKQKAQPPSSRSNSRYRGYPIGNAQNLFIRNILSSLGLESLNEEDWNSTKEYFSHKCAYCGAETDLLMEHAIPINKAKLGEHRLGNLVPSCQLCNSNKGSKDFRQFLEENTAAIGRIEEYMDSRNYVPLENNEQMKMILNIAHKEIAALADRYITIINELFSQSEPQSVADATRPML
jgi:5-methylcytosine-specific restriction endonuclease McrA